MICPYPDLQPLDRDKRAKREPLRLDSGCVVGDPEITLMAGKPGKDRLRFVDSHPCRDETASRVGHPDICIGAKVCWCERPDAFNSER